MASPLPSSGIAQVVAELTQRVRRLERGRLPGQEDAIPSGNRQLDRLLGAGGFRRGTLVEWLAGPLAGGATVASGATGAGGAAGACGATETCGATGAGTLALIAAREAARAGGAIVVVDRAGLFYPPAAVRLGIDLETLIVVRPESDGDQAWALDQVLRTRGVAAAWCLLEKQDDHTLRRWQLAAETSGVLGLLVRPADARARTLVGRMPAAGRAARPIGNRGPQSPFARDAVALARRGCRPRDRTGDSHARDAGRKG